MIEQPQNIMCFRVIIKKHPQGYLVSRIEAVDHKRNVYHTGNMFPIEIPDWNEKVNSELKEISEVIEKTSSKYINLISIIKDEIKKYQTSHPKSKCHKVLLSRKNYIRLQDELLDIKPEPFSEMLNVETCQSIEIQVVDNEHHDYLQIATSEKTPFEVSNELPHSISFKIK